MSRKNIDTVRGFIDAINHNQFDRFFEFCSQDAVSHAPPFVGLGLHTDDSSGTVVVLGAAPGGPADGVLLPGDKLVRVWDSNHTWETFDELKGGLWGQGIPDTPLTVTVERDGKVIDLQLLRGSVKAFDLKFSDMLEPWRQYKLKVWPDLKTEIQFIFEKDDLVAFFGIDSGINLEFHRTATWGECSIFRVRDGKIVESWSIEDAFAQLKQLGYDIREPHREPAA